MSATFQLDVPSPQRRFWHELTAVPAEFVLYESTALALHLAPRTSVDFDFFAEQQFDPGRLATQLPFLKGGTITRQEASTLSVLVERGGPVFAACGLPTSRVVTGCESPLSWTWQGPRPLSCKSAGALVLRRRQSAEFAARRSGQAGPCRSHRGSRPFA